MSTLAPDLELADRIQRMGYVRACLLEYVALMNDETAVKAVMAIWRQVQSLSESAAPTQPAAPMASEPVGAPFGIIDPDYARIFTQARIIAWQFGYACVMHGSFTRDLDLVFVPWEKHAGANCEQLMKLIAQATGLKFRDGKEDIFESVVDWSEKPHGRKACSLYFRGFGDRRWVDISFVPTQTAAPAQAADVAFHTCPRHDHADIITNPKEGCPKCNAETTTDAARYRWLRDYGFKYCDVSLGSNFDDVDFVHVSLRFHIPEPVGLKYEENEWTLVDFDVAIDAAIDAEAADTKGGAA